MNLSRRASFLGKSVALWVAITMVVLFVALSALGLLIAAFIVWLSHLLGFAAAAAIAGGILLVIAAIIMGVGALALRRRRTRLPSLTSEALGMASLGMRMAAFVIRRDPSKALLVAMLAGALAEHFSRSRSKE
ncbi:MAG: hypothetical protein KGH75_02530 [Rhodospirillales bacterium]|nr:hypothetical protein [Rhodospirillales bacterium]